MHKVREILRLRAAGLTEREVAASVGCARSTVQDCLKRAAAAGIGWPLPQAVLCTERRHHLAPAKADVTPSTPKLDPADQLGLEIGTACHRRPCPSESYRSCSCSGYTSDR